MKNERVDELIRLAWLEGWISTHGGYEKAVAKRKAGHSVSPASRTLLVERLESALAETKQPMPLTIGELLRGLRSEQVLRSKEIFSRIGVGQNIYRMMEQDTISPLKIPVEVWNKLIKLLDLSIEEAVQMIRRTHQLVLFRPSFKGVLARYSSGKKKSLKTSTLEKAYSELYAKADLQIPEFEEAKLKSLFAHLRDSANAE